ncbi:MAG TPA: hypothetical protein VFW07_11515 [Parafilimonas sp.]|nr:hypothetical protein [Parafilimonas sp.]
MDREFIALNAMNTTVSLKNGEDLNDIFCVIVLYKTDLPHSASFNSVLKAVENADGTLHILLYNNFPEIHLDTTLYARDNIHVSVINDDANSGVSKAYNEANAMASSRRRKWLLLLDQDTALPENFFAVFFSERKQAAKDYKLYIPVIRDGNKIISPAKYFLYRGFIRKEVKKGEAQLRDQAIINSGVIVDNDLFKQAGGFNENVNLDFSDVSFFRRLRKIYSIVFVLDVICSHSFSGLEYDSYEKNFTRFKIYNANAIAFSKEKGVNKPLLFLTVLVRVANLSLKFKTLSFLRSLKFS